MMDVNVGCGFLVGFTDFAFGSQITFGGVGDLVFSADRIGYASAAKGMLPAGLVTVVETDELCLVSQKPKYRLRAFKIVPN